MGGFHGDDLDDDDDTKDCHHDDDIDRSGWACGDDNDFRTRYSKGVSAVETILLVDRLRQQATQSSLSSPPCIFNHLYYNQL